MKQPRYDAFDPKIQPPPLQSPLTGYPAIQKPTVPDRQPPPGPGASAPTKRKVRVRYSVDIFEDQIERLHQYRARELQRTGRGSISRMVREALDDYIRRRDHPTE